MVPIDSASLQQKIQFDEPRPGCPADGRAFRWNPNGGDEFEQSLELWGFSQTNAIPCPFCGHQTLSTGPTVKEIVLSPISGPTDSRAISAIWNTFHDEPQ